jgi:hypothetical protein
MIFTFIIIPTNDFSTSFTEQNIAFNTAAATPWNTHTLADVIRDFSALLWLASCSHALFPCIPRKISMGEQGCRGLNEGITNTLKEVLSTSIG